MKLLLDPYSDCCCSDCAEYGAETDDECEVFNAWVARAPQGFGDGIKVGPCTSKCQAFKPSASLLMDMADAAAYRREKLTRASAKSFEVAV